MNRHNENGLLSGMLLFGIIGALGYAVWDRCTQDAHRLPWD